MVLYTANNYFRTILTKQEQGRSGNIIMEISIKHIDGEILLKLIKYCYTGKIYMHSANVERIAKAATKLEFTDILLNCRQFLSSILRSSNCLEIREIAVEHNMVRLKKKAQAFLLDHFVEVSQSEKFYKLNVEQLNALLRDDEISVTSEEEVFNALMGWVKHDLGNRKQKLQGLLKCVRFQHIEHSVSTLMAVFCV